MTQLMKTRALVALVAGAALWGCTTGTAGVPPAVTTGPLGGTLQMAVGTANLDGGAGLNVLETFRGSNGYSAVPINTATLTGPGGFAGYPGSADPGAGAAAVPLGSANNAYVVGPSGSNLDAAQAFGVGPPGSGNTVINPFPFQPQFGDVSGFGEGQVYGDPPAYPAPSVLPGYPEMFYTIALPAAPPTGAYTLTVSYSQNGASSSKSTSATLASNTLLPLMPSPSYASDGAGGGTVSVTNPAGVTESLVDIDDTTSGVLATVVTHGAGPQTGTVPDGTFGSGDSLMLVAIGFDYNDYELSLPPPSQAPALPASADMTVSAFVGGTGTPPHHAIVRHTHW